MLTQGTQARQEQVEALLELRRAVIAGQRARQRPQPGELPYRQPMQTQSQQVVGLVRVVHQGLQLVEDVAVQESGERSVGSQCDGGRKARLDQELEEVLQRSQGWLLYTSPSPRD